MDRKEDLDKFYQLLHRLENQVGGKQQLKDCDGYMDWPDRGIYFFFAADEHRDNGDHLRLTRVGTHAVSEGSSTTLWNRLRTHRGALNGTYVGGGNHRGSVVRERVGETLIEIFLTTHSATVSGESYKLFLGVNTFQRKSSIPVSKAPDAIFDFSSTEDLIES